MRRFRITVDGTPYEVCVEELEEPTEQTSAATQAVPMPRAAVPRQRSVSQARAASAAGEGEVLSPLAATVARVEVAVGAQVSAGQRLVLLEAMKMNSPVSAPRAGRIRAVHVGAGDAVAEGQPLVTLD